jgi:hypothetical protein
VTLGPLKTYGGLYGEVNDCQFSQERPRFTSPDP